MELIFKNCTSVYELENTVRLFFPGIERSSERIKNSNRFVYIRQSQKSLFFYVKYEEDVTSFRMIRSHDQNEEYLSCERVYNTLVELTGLRPPWGMLTGVRPVRLFRQYAEKLGNVERATDTFKKKYQVSDAKIRLLNDIYEVQNPLLAENKCNDFSLYIGIPFCPSRCSYCSFVSKTIASQRQLVQPYLDHLILEIREIKRLSDVLGLNLKSIYIGGGTPTSLDAKQTEQLLHAVSECFDLDKVNEFTVEAGRPDCTDREKLHIMKQYGVDRISINPQSFNPDVLHRIGRVHTVEQLYKCFDDARKEGHKIINMDLIAGLPGESVDSFINSLYRTLELDPENITVHTLTLKRASNIVIDKQNDEYGDVSKMIDATQELYSRGYKPYYLYRQKNTLRNLENTGWSKPGTECIYNIYIMEETHSIFSAGAGGSTKICLATENKIERIFNYKYPSEYISRFDNILKRKETIIDFYHSLLK